jgi:soluble lytic murein transglycosylase-like protein
MEFQGRISAIKMRMQDIQSKFGASSISSVPTGLNPTAGMQGTGSTAGVTFDKILATKMEGAGGFPMPGTSQTASSPALSSKASDFDSIINEASTTYNVDPRFVKAIIQQESGFNPNATSPCGAMGMMQLMPDTARGLGVRNGYDAKENIMGGVKYIKQQLDAFGGDKEKALAAYNAGPGAVQKFGGVPPYAETQNYVKNIMSMYNGMGGN